jgi:hypothetical protein
MPGFHMTQCILCSPEINDYKELEPFLIKASYDD